MKKIFLIHNFRKTDVWHFALISWCFLVMLLLFSVPVAAQIDPIKLVDDAGKYLLARSSIQVDANMVMNIQDGNQQGSMSVDCGFILGKGNEAILHLKTDNEDIIIYNNRSKRDIYFVNDKKFREFPAEAKRAQLFKTAVSGPIQGAMLWLADFLHGVDFVYEKAPVYVGAEEIDGAIHHVVDMTFPQYTVRAYLSISEPVMLRRITVELRGDALKGFVKTPDGSVRVMADFTNWKIDRVLSDDTFIFTPPPGVTFEKEERKTSTDPLLNKKAPDFTLPTLDGKEVTLSQHQGKDIVVLDFFASWCGPCRQAMPIVISVVGGFKDKNVVLYGVNMREPAEKIHDFLKSTGLSVNVLLDKGTVAQKYNVTGIPRLVIIGKDGIVKIVHGGMSPDLKQQLTDDIKALL